MARETPQLGFIGSIVQAAGMAYASSQQRKAAREQRKAAEAQAEAQVKVAEESSPVRYVEALFDEQNLYWQEELDRMAYRSSALTGVMADMQASQERSASATKTSATTGLAAAGLVGVTLLGLAWVARRRR